MPIRRRTPLNPAQNVAVSSVATFDLPVDRRYHGIHLEYRNSGTGVLKTQALIATEITRIELLLNGIVQRTLKPGWIKALYALKGIALPDGYIPLDFSLPWMRDTAHEDAGAWSVRGNVATFQIAVTLGAGAVASKLDGFTEDDDVQAPFLIAKNTVIRPPVSGVGITTVGQLPTKGLFRNLHCFEQAANDIKSVRLKVDNREVYYLTRDRANYMAGRYGMVAQAGLFPVMFDGLNRWDHVLPSHAAAGNVPLAGGAFPTTIEFDMAVANTFDMVCEYIAPGV